HPCFYDRGCILYGTVVEWNQQTLHMGCFLRDLSWIFIFEQGACFVVRFIFTISHRVWNCLSIWGTASRFQTTSHGSTTCFSHYLPCSFQLVAPLHLLF